MSATVLKIKSENQSPYLEFSIEDIVAAIPHRYPMLFVDKLENVILGEEAIGVKNVTINESFFVGHFPGKPVMPGIFIIEAMAQTAAVLVMKTLEITHADHIVYFMSINEARFRKPVFPGDTIKMHVKRQHNRGNVWKFAALACVDGIPVADAVYTAMIKKK